MGNGLTPKQKRLTAELDHIYTLLGMDYWNIEERVEYLSEASNETNVF